LEYTLDAQFYDDVMVVREEEATDSADVPIMMAAEMFSRTRPRIDARGLAFLPNTKPRLQTANGAIAGEIIFAKPVESSLLQNGAVPNGTAEAGDVIVSRPVIQIARIGIDVFSAAEAVGVPREKFNKFSVE
jgi:hypothetical protein